jgi:hypothetical protein
MSSPRRSIYTDRAIVTHLSSEVTVQRDSSLQLSYNIKSIERKKKVGYPYICPKDLRKTTKFSGTAVGVLAETHTKHVRCGSHKS